MPNDANLLFSAVYENPLILILLCFIFQLVVLLQLLSLPYACFFLEHLVVLAFVRLEKWLTGMEFHLQLVCMVSAILGTLCSQIYINQWLIKQSSQKHF